MTFDRKKKVKQRHRAAAMHRGFPRQPARKRGRALLCAVCFFAAILTVWLVSWLYMGYVVAGEHVVQKPAEQNDARDLGAQQLLKSARQGQSEPTSDHVATNTTAAALRCVGQMAGESAQILIRVCCFCRMEMTSPAPTPADSSRGSFDVEFRLARIGGGSNVNKGRFVVRFHPKWAPLGVARVLELVESDFFKDVRFFRVLPNFMAQFGISGDPATAAHWHRKVIQDDPVSQTNKKGYVTFATSGKNSRTTQLFINFKHNQFLDGQGFSPVGEVVEGFSDVERINAEYRELPKQAVIQTKGNEYLQSKFPRLTFITSVRILGREEPGEGSLRGTHQGDASGIESMSDLAGTSGPRASGKARVLPLHRELNERDAAADAPTKVD